MAYELTESFVEPTALFERHCKAFDAAQRHAKRCKKCFIPIIDEEGNPGRRSEACAKGLPLLLEIIETDRLLLNLPPGVLSAYIAGEC